MIKCLFDGTMLKYFKVKYENNLMFDDLLKIVLVRRDHGS